MLQCVRLLATDKSKHISREAAARHDFTRVHFDPMESDRRPKLLFGGIFFDEPVSTSSENALADRSYTMSHPGCETFGTVQT